MPLPRLESGEPFILKELAHTFQVDVSTIKRQVGAMRRAGLVERVPEPDGGAARRVRPATLGLEHLDAGRVISRGGTARLVRASGWEDERTQQLLDLLVRLNQGIEHLEGLARPGSAAPAQDSSGRR